MPAALEGQIDEFYRSVEEVMGELRGRMEQGLQVVSRIPGVTHADIQPWLDKFNQATLDVNQRVEETTQPLGDAKVMCRRLMTLREAGEFWKNDIAAQQADPLAQSLTRTSLDTKQFSWVSGAVDRYWTHIDGNQETADELATVSEEMGKALVALADAIDKQNSDLAWAIGGTVMAIIGLLGGGLGLAMAIGALVGAPAGGPVGALIGAIVGAVLALIGAIWGLITAIKAWVDATKVIGTEGATQLEELQSRMSDLAGKAWPAPQQYGTGDDFREK